MSEKQKCTQFFVSFSFRIISSGVLLNATNEIIAEVGSLCFAPMA